MAYRSDQSRAPMMTKPPASAAANEAVRLSVPPAGSDMKHRLSDAGRLAAGLLSAVVALVSYRYLAQLGPMPANIAQNRFVSPWIMVHVGGAATALLLGPFQFLPAVRRRWPMVHRWAGRAYVVGCLVGGASALILSAGVSTGPVAGTGFGVLGMLWTYVTAQGWLTARARRFSEHRRWMIRSFALTFAAVTLRLYLTTALALRLDFVSAYQAIAWLAWVPNAILAELYLTGDGQSRRRSLIAEP